MANQEPDFFNDIVGGMEEQGAKLNKEVLSHLFSKDRDKLLMITDLTPPDDIVWATSFQAMLRFLVEDFVDDRKLRNKCFKFMEDIYKMRISMNRKGRTELFDALKTQTTYEMAKEHGLMGRIRGKLSGV